MSATDAKDGVTLIPTGEIREKKSVNTRILIVLWAVGLILGTINLYSGSAGGALFYTQLKHIALGFCLFVFCGWVVQPRHLHAYAYWLFGFVCALLVAVLVLGRVGLGAQRWLNLGFMGLQPSEPAKIIIAIICARFFNVSKLNHPYRIRDLWPLLAMVGVIFGLIFPQPDFGTAGVCLIIAATQICFMRLDRRSLAIVATLVAACAPVLWFFVLRDYQRARIVNFLDHDNDLRGSGYNALQSLVAIGSGGLNGKGFMKGTQTQLSFLPMSHTDFAFAVFAEEWGFFGAALLVLLFAGIAYVAFEIARQAKDTFSALLAVGLAAFIFFECAINIAMVLRMFPIVGIPLPLFTYGGTIMLMVSAALGILVSVDRDNLGLHKKSASLRRGR